MKAYQTGAHPERDSDNYVTASKVTEVKEGELLSMTISGESILVTRVNGQLRAFSAACPHAAGNLAKGSYYKGRIDCPDHGYRFDVLTGHPLWPEDEVCRLRFFGIKEEDGVVKIQLT